MVKGTLYVVLAISDLEDPDIVGEPIIRVQGEVGGTDVSLPLETAKHILNEEQMARVEKMIGKLSNWKY